MAPEAAKTNTPTAFSGQKRSSPRRTSSGKKTLCSKASNDMKTTPSKSSSEKKTTPSKTSTGKKSTQRSGGTAANPASKKRKERPSDGNRSSMKKKVTVHLVLYHQMLMTMTLLN